MMKTTRIWDLPTRIFHWLLAAAVIGLVISGKVGGNAMTWHIRLGYVVFALLVFRVIWGLVGGHWSRFTSFFPTPARLGRYLRGKALAQDTAGHTPLGALSVFAMLLVLGAQVGTGLISDDEIAFSGPLTALVSGDTVNLATGYHKDWGQLLVIALIVLHIVAVLIYWVAKKNNLIKPMLGGDKTLAAEVVATRDSAKTRWLALVVLLAAIAIVYTVVGLASPALN
ncbi:cytochrome b/b6 domain-containing protein [Ottowia thiooxydans]|uniref:Cytochrome b n=1 Tax=Ottowia thiooxydans TaxID=219182 RepID=A0ABV2QAL3_9BURK